MCGITGSFDLRGQNTYNREVDVSLEKLSKRGPDNQSSHQINSVHLGHTRLSIIDLSEHANQPFISQCKNYILVFNGEIYNFNEIKETIKNKYDFQTSSDTEVLLNSYIEYGKDCLNKLNGFFSFALYDVKKDSLFLARDRFGIKPLYYFKSENSFFFSSELKALSVYPISKDIDSTSLKRFFEYTYISGKDSVFKDVKKLLPGSYLEVTKDNFVNEKFYTLNYDKKNLKSDYKNCQDELRNLLDESVKLRLISDAPLGAFLSGGIDSSVIVALASKYKKNLKTFSIGYKDNTIHDETKYAEAVANKFGTDHYTLKLSNDDYVENIYKILDYVDEPFADSSQIPTFILSQFVKEHVTVALSGDGADELFAGYNKYLGEIHSRKLSPLSPMFKLLKPLTAKLPQSRDYFVSNKIRQINKFVGIASQNRTQRYFDLCRFNSEKQVERVLKKNISYNQEEYLSTPLSEDINSFLYNDIYNILPGDMLTKVDQMSMANSLEVRVPFLDHNLVEFAFKIPEKFKIDQNMKKKVLQDAFRDLLPAMLYNRPKQGFSLSLMSFFKNELWSLINDKLLSEQFIKEQDIFNYSEIDILKKKIQNNTRDDIQPIIWALIVFQTWWRKEYL